MKIVAIIPARGGSQSIKNKNIRPFCGRPLIHWSITAAKKSNLVGRVIVSTDSTEIQEAAIASGAECPFLRPEDISGPKAGVEPALIHAYEWLIKNENYKADLLCLLLPTNPLRQSFHIDQALEMAVNNKVDSVIAVNQTPANHTPYWTLVKNQQTGKVTWFSGEDIKKGYTRRQDFPQQCFARNEIIFVMKPQNLYQNPPNLYGDTPMLYETDPLYEGDLNTPEEWLITETKFEVLQKLNKLQ